MYTVTADDGRGSVVKLRLSRRELCRMIGGAIVAGVNASQRIEDDDALELTLQEPVNLPEGLLQI